MSAKQKIVATYLVLAAVFSTACFKSKIAATRVPSTGNGGVPLGPNGKPLKVNGVFYALPRTVVKIDVPVTMTIETPAELERFTPCFFSEEVSKNRITEAGRSFSIEPATFSSRGEPDPNQHFIVKTKGGYFEHKSMLLEYTPEGVLTKGEAESQDESLEFAVKTAKTIISVAAKAANPAGLKFAGADPQRVKIEFQVCRGVLAAEQAGIVAKLAKKVATVVPAAGAQANNAETEAKSAKGEAEKAKTEVTESNAQTDANNAIAHARLAEAATRTAGGIAGAIPEATAATEAANRLDGILRAVADPATGQPTARFTTDYQKAVEVNDTIKRLQAQREDLASGGGTLGGFAGGGSSIPPDTLKLMLKETDDTIESYQNSYFLGTSTEKNWTGPFEFTPPTAGPPAPPAAVAPVTSGTFFWFEETEGLCEGPVADALGIKIPKKFKPKSGCAVIPAGSVQVAVRIQRKSDDDGFLANVNAAHNADEIKDQQRGFYYRIPAKANVILQAGAKDLARSDLIVAQFGIVASLPASSSGRTTQYTIALDESTGALKNFKLGSDSLVQKSILDDVGTSANAIVDAKKAREKAKAEANDILAQKKRELELLKTQNEINEEKKKLESGGASGNPKP